MPDSQMPWGLLGPSHRPDQFRPTPFLSLPFNSTQGTPAVYGNYLQNLPRNVPQGQQGGTGLGDEGSPAGGPGSYAQGEGQAISEGYTRPWGVMPQRQALKPLAGVQAPKIDQPQVQQQQQQAPAQGMGFSQQVTNIGQMGGGGGEGALSQQIVGSMFTKPGGQGGGGATSAPPSPAAEPAPAAGGGGGTVTGPDGTRPPTLQRGPAPGTLSPGVTSGQVGIGAPEGGGGGGKVDFGKAKGWGGDATERSSQFGFPGGYPGHWGPKSVEMHEYVWSFSKPYREGKKKRDEEGDSEEEGAEAGGGHTPTPQGVGLLQQGAGGNWGPTRFI